MINENFIYLALLIDFLGGISYFIYTLQGKVQPNRVTWVLWGIIPLIAFLAQIKQSVGIQSLFTLIIGITPFLVFAASFVNKKSSWQINKIDILCGILSLLGIILWVVTGVGNIAIIFSILADLMAGIPTLVKSFYNPESENYLAYLATGIASIITLLTIRIWNFQTFAFSLYILIICLLFILFIKFKLGKIILKKLTH
jgi:hypothetical protein